jgi:iron-sulfur cluster repair protein YtfE (RIC family)
MDVFTLLKTDHEKVSGIFDKLEETTERAAKTREELFAQLKQELDVHAHIEETILYPALKEASQTREITVEAYEEHAEVKELLARIEQTPPGEAKWTDLVAELRHNVEHHVDEEESELFDAARDVLSGAQIDDITRRVQEAKQQGAKATGAATL